MTRRAHYLRGSSSSAMPREIVVFDTETVEHRLDERTVEHVLRFGYAAYLHINRHGNWSAPKWFRFETPEEFWGIIESLTQPKKRLYTFCHNGNFDWQVVRMFSQLPNMAWRCDKAIIEDPPNYFLWKKDDRSLAMLDTTNYWQESLEKIGKSVGVEKLTMPAMDAPLEQWDRYGKQDVVVLIAALLRRFKWLQDHDMGSFAISQAGQAWTAYRHRFMDHPIFMDDNPKALRLARDSYMGGRTEAWVLNQELTDVYEVDVNQMYPYVMRDNLYPTKLMSVYKHVSISELSDWLSRYCVVARVTIDTDEPIYPERRPFGITFPVGRFETILTTPELDCALQRGHLAECDEAAVYECAPIFTRWVDELHELRVGFAKAGDLLSSDYAKKQANSLYGKFGQRGGHEEIIGYTDDVSLRVESEVDIDTGKRYRIRHIAGLILSRSLDEETRDSHPAIASHVTAYARQLLWQYAEKAGLAHVFYMDTDSLHVDGDGYAALAALIDQHRLGALKTVREKVRAIYRGAKDYDLADTTKIKGIRKKAVEVEPGTYEQEQWVSIRGSCTVNHTGGPLVRRVVKHLSRLYRKGEPTATGRVLPLRRDTR